MAGIPVLLSNPEQHVELWRKQLGSLLERGQGTLAALTDTASAARLAPATRARLNALVQAVHHQIDDLAAILGPALGGAAVAAGARLPRGVVEYLGYLHRDWAWPAVGYHENELALTELAQLLGPTGLARTLVLGAGACGLARELHLRHRARETVALDVDPYLLVIAEHVLRGGSVRLTEASVKWIEAGDVSRSWLLKSAAPLGREVFRCLFADGLAPPFAPDSFDTIVTPWFIDQVVRDLPAFLGTLHRLLRRGGRWVNQGPLVYAEQTPFERRYAREELFDLAVAAGFEVEGWTRSSHRYLVSPLTGNGKIESVLTFVATRR